MNLNETNHLSRRVIITIIVVSALFGTLPLFVNEIQHPTTSQKAEAATLTLKQFSGLTWSKPSEENVSVLENEKTDKESLTLAVGQKSQAIVTSDLSSTIFSFYESQLLSQRFIRTKLIGLPGKDAYWVASYQQDTKYVEIEYYPTPYKVGSSTVTLFFGTLKEKTSDQ